MGKKTWTRKLKELIQNNTQLNIKFHGPYGNVNLDHNIFILLAGGKLISFFFILKKGIGVTPMISILQELFYNKNKLTKVYFNWSVKVIIILFINRISMKF
jgi:NAD(P)H-flavin reductase